jgi:hypothetical protein
MRPFVRFRGSIAGAGFTSGDRFVVGIWTESPFGPFSDVMWSRPDGTRILVAHGASGTFIERHYRFDEVRSSPVEVGWRDSTLTVQASDVTLTLEVGSSSFLSALLRARSARLGRLPAWMALEDMLLRPLTAPLIGSARGIRVRGRTAAGAREWYVLEGHRPITSGTGAAGALDLGSVTVVDRRMGFGFSEFPVRPALVTVSSLFEQSSLEEPFNRQ